MATQLQKADATLKLINNPNKKLSSKYLEKIKFSPEPTIRFTGLENLKLFCTQYVSKGDVLYIRWKIKNTDYSPTQMKKLKAIGFTEIFGWLTYGGYVDLDMSSNTNLLRLIQNLTVPVECEELSYDSIMFDFLSRIENNDFPDYRQWNARHLACFDYDEVKILDRSLGLNGILEHYYGDKPKSSAGGVVFEHTADGYVIKTFGDLGYVVVTDTPLTVHDIIRLNQYSSIREDILIRYLNLEIENKISYEDKTKPTDPLLLFNQAIDELQSSDLPLKELAKELIFLSAKHLA